jgi:hypothetical protein
MTLAAGIIRGSSLELISENIMYSMKAAKARPKLAIPIAISTEF